MMDEKNQGTTDICGKVYDDLEKLARQRSFVITSC